MYKLPQTKAANRLTDLLFTFIRVAYFDLCSVSNKRMIYEINTCLKVWEKDPIRTLTVSISILSKHIEIT